MVQLSCCPYHYDDEHQALSRFAAAAPGVSMTPLAGIRVLDFSTLLPGPLATLILAEAGAEVIKIERPGGGDEMRRREPRFGADSALFAMLNRGKRSVAIDLKDPRAVVRLAPLLAGSDVLVEQFRPGVMDRLGLGYEAVRAMNPRIIYCALTGYGQNGVRAARAGHDLNYLAESGLLSLVTGAGGVPAMPAAPFSDIAGGTYPLVINVLLALHRRAETGQGCFLDIAMAENMIPFAYWALARGFGSGAWPGADADPITGASPRYRCYGTRDRRFVAVAALEDKFWREFCDLVDLPGGARDDRVDPVATMRAVSETIASRDAAEWEHLFGDRDICCSVVKTVQEAANDPAFVARGMFAHRVAGAGRSIPALPVPLAAVFRHEAAAWPAPPLGNDTDMLEEAP